MLAHAIESLDALSAFFRQVHAEGGGKTPDLSVLAELKQKVLQGVVSAHRAAAKIAANQPKRHKLNGGSR